MNPAMVEVAHLSFSSGLVAASSSSSVDDSALSSSSESVTGDLLQKNKALILPLWLLCSCVNGMGYLGTFVHAYVGKQLHTYIYKTPLDICAHLLSLIHISEPTRR